MPLQAGTAALPVALDLIQGNFQCGFPYPGKTICELASGPAGRILLSGVSVINYFPVGNIFCSHLGKFLQQDRGQRKITGRKDAAAGCLCDRVYLVIILAAESGCSDDHMRAVL